MNILVTQKKYSHISGAITIRFIKGIKENSHAKTLQVFSKALSFSLVFIFAFAALGVAADTDPDIPVLLVEPTIENVETPIPEIIGEPVLEVIPEDHLNSVLSSSPIIEKSVFTENEQSTVFVKPFFNDGSTNIAFYIPYGSPDNWVWQSETPAVGGLPFSSYWGPTPPAGPYIIIEYVNDQQQFSCSGLSLQECLDDPHIISKANFEILANEQSEF